MHEGLCFHEVAKHPWSDGDLSLTQLGRRLQGPAHEKHQIKAVDRLLGNRHLHRERDRVYAAIAKQVLGGIARPLIVVDWSDFEPGHRFAMLKAAVLLGGQAITVYERVFAFKRYNSRAVERGQQRSRKQMRGSPVTVPNPPARVARDERVARAGFIARGEDREASPALHGRSTS